MEELNKNAELDNTDKIKCPFCDSTKILESMFIEEWDCYNCLKPFKKKDFKSIDVNLSD